MKVLKKTERGSRVERRVNPDSRYNLGIMILSICVVVLTVGLGIATFFLTIRSEEQTTVPDLRGMALENALLRLEERGLFQRLQLHYSQDPTDKGTILGQEPDPGATVKVGKRILLKVSRGAIVERMENFIGWNLDDLETHIKSLASVYGSLIELTKPVVGVYDNSEPGTILEQKPIPGTELVVGTTLHLVVSKGPQGDNFKVLDYTDMAYQDAIDSLARTNTPFMFTSNPPEDGETPGTIISQFPTIGTVVPRGTIIQLVLAEPEEELDGEVFGIFRGDLPILEFPASVLVEAVHPDGTVKVLMQTNHPGGSISIPYLEPVNTTIRVITGSTTAITYTIREFAQ